MEDLGSIPQRQAMYLERQRVQGLRYFEGFGCLKMLDGVWGFRVYCLDASEGLSTLAQKS